MKEVADVLREYQYEKNLTQHDMAKFLGIAQPTYNNWINGQSVVSPVKYYEKIAKLCGIDIDTIYPPHKLYPPHKFVESNSHELEANSKGLIYCEKYVLSLEEMNEFLKQENKKLLENLKEKNVVIEVLKASKHN